MQPLPQSLSDITTEWLGDRLGVEVESLAVEPMSGVVGALGEVGILAASYAAAVDLPARFVAKIPLNEDTAKMYNGLMQFPQREGVWYRDFAAAAPLRGPRPFVNEVDPETGHTVLVIALVDDAERGDTLAGASFERHSQVIDALAALHGAFQGSASIRSNAGLWGWDHAGWRAGAELMWGVWPIFHDMRPDVFPDDLREFLTRTWVADTDKWLTYLDAQPSTLCHGDYQLDNLLFAADGPVAIDYQCAARSFGGFDLGWYLASSLPPEQREFEPELIERYRSQVAAAGGRTYSPDELMDELALSSLQFATSNTLPALQDTSAFGEQGERMRRRFDQFLDGSIAAALRWDVMGRAPTL